MPDPGFPFWVSTFLRVGVLGVNGFRGIRGLGFRVEGLGPFGVFLQGRSSRFFSGGFVRGLCKDSSVRLLWFPVGAIIKIIMFNPTWGFYYNPKP